MKNLLYIFAAGAMLASLCSCDDDHKPDWNETAPFDVKPTSLSIQDGATVSPSVNTIEVVYDHDIALNSAVAPTLTGGTLNSFSVVDGNTLVADVTLRYGGSYTFTIPARCVAGIGSKTFAPEITISFTTEIRSNVADYSLASASLTDAAATQEAKDLYAFLKSNYGNKQLSGAMGEVAWGTGFCDVVSAKGGKYPAIVGFDYIHLASSPSNWIDYGDITPVKEAWKAGSIPAFTWHWNVPVSKDESSDLNARSDVFNAANVLVEGSWENKIAEADVEKLAGYLKLIQDEGIPVIWRPFHEAAGDYTWGAWFWWGKSGVETTKQLWNWLRDKLINVYGIHNLIWTWTVQTSDAGNPAALSKLQEAYPGDENVDVIGTDIYDDNSLSDQTEQFALLYDLVKGKKIIALTECGNLTDVNSAAAAKALWCWFMVWYEMNDGEPAIVNWNTGNEWKTVMDNSKVLNRGDFSL